MKNKARIIDIIIFVAILAVFLTFFARLVYCQTIYAEMTERGYNSDILAYMQEMQGIDSGYSFPYPLFFAMGRFFNLFLPIDLAITVAEVLLNGLAVVISKYYFEKLLTGKDPAGNDTADKETSGDKWYRHVIITLAVFACFMMSMWWLPRFGKVTLPFKDQVFYGTYSGNPWHNATYIATRPFAIGCFFSFFDVLTGYEKKFNLKDHIIFSVFLLLTTLTKPSFTLTFVSASGIVLLVKLFVSKFKNIKSSLILAAFYVPTFIALIIQFGGVFGSGNTEAEHGIGFDGFKLWTSVNPHILPAVVYANIFSLVCLVFFAKEIIRDEKYRFSVIFFAVAFLEAGLLCEKGFRYSHFNFSWGYMHGIFFFEMMALIKLLEATFSKKMKLIFLLICWLFFASQVVAGVLYFAGIYRGLDYNTLLPASWL